MNPWRKLAHLLRIIIDKLTCWEDYALDMAYVPMKLTGGYGVIPPRVARDSMVQLWGRSKITLSSLMNAQDKANKEARESFRSLPKTGKIVFRRYDRLTPSANSICNCRGCSGDGMNPNES